LQMRGQEGPLSACQTPSWRTTRRFNHTERREPQEKLSTNSSIKIGRLAES
jgi:hypothetical protein